MHPRHAHYSHRHETGDAINRIRQRKGDHSYEHARQQAAEQAACEQVAHAAHREAAHREAAEVAALRRSAELSVRYPQNTAEHQAAREQASSKVRGLQDSGNQEAIRRGPPSPCPTRGGWGALPAAPAPVVLPKMSRGSITEEHVQTAESVDEIVYPDQMLYDYGHETTDEKKLVSVDEQQIVQVVQEIIKVPRVRKEERVVLKEVPSERIVQKVKEVPRYEKRVVKIPVIRFEEEVKVIQKVKYVDEVIEIPVTNIRIEEVVEVVDRRIPRIVEKKVKKPIIQYVDIIKVRENSSEHPIEVNKYTYETVVVEVPIETIEEVPKYVEVPQLVERVSIKHVEKIVEEVVERPVTKIVTREVIRQIPVTKTVRKEIPVEKVVEVPKRIEVVRHVPVEQEQEFEVPKYVENIKNVFHHTKTKIESKQKLVVAKKLLITHNITEQQQVTVKHKVVHVPKFVEYEVLEFVDVVIEVPVDTVKIETIEIPKVIYQDIDEEVVEVRKRVKYVEQEVVSKVAKYVQVPQEQVVRITKIEFRDHVQIVENLIEVPEITYQDRIKWVDTNVSTDKTVEVPVVKTITEYKEVPVVRKVEKRIEVPKIQYVENVIEIPTVRIVKKYVDVVNEVEKVVYKDVEVEEIQEEIVEVVTVKRIEKPEVVYVDKEVIVPKIIKVEKIVIVEREVHHAVHEETSVDKRGDDSEVLPDEVVEYTVMMKEALTPEIMEADHEWDRSKVPAEYKDYALPPLTADGHIDQDYVLSTGATYVPPKAAPIPVVLAPVPVPMPMPMPMQAPMPGYRPPPHMHDLRHMNGRQSKACAWYDGRPSNSYGGRFVDGKNSIYF